MSPTNTKLSEGSMMLGFDTMASNVYNMDYLHRTSVDAGGKANNRKGKARQIQIMMLGGRKASVIGAIAYLLSKSTV
jgi:hypothetical protein